MAALFSYLTGGKRERRGRDESASEAQPTLNSNRSVWCVLSVFHCVDAAGSLNTCCKTHTIPLIWAGVTGDGAVICVLTRSELDYKNWEAWFSEVFRCESFDSQRDFWQNVGTDGHHCVFASGFTRCGGAKQGRSDKVNKCLKKSLSWKIMLFVDILIDFTKREFCFFCSCGAYHELRFTCLIVLLFGCHKEKRALFQFKEQPLAIKLRS